MNAACDSEGTQRLIAWSVVLGLHLGLLWLLAALPSLPRTEAEPFPMRLVFVTRTPAPLPEPLTASPRPAATPARPQATFVQKSAPSRVQPQDVAETPIKAAIGEPIDWQRQASDAVRQQSAPDTRAFEPDPLRSRRAHLPGGDGRERFAMRQAVTPANVVGMIGGLFGSYPPPCPRVRENIAGLLTSTSARDRELLQEELRQQREYCAP